MDRRRFLLTSLAGALAGPLAAEAQQAGKIARVGLLMPGSSADARTNVEAFRQGLRELGHIEGQNIAIEPACRFSCPGSPSMCSYVGSRGAFGPRTSEIIKLHLRRARDAT